MKKIWIVGNVLKDIYLELDETNQFEKGEEATWLDVAFKEKTYPYFRRHAVYGGAAVSMEVLTKFGADARVAGADIQVNGERIVPDAQATVGHRYILCHNDDVAYLTPSGRAETQWVAPRREVDWVFVDRSAVVTPELVRNIKKYLTSTRKTRLAVHFANEPSPADYDLLKSADLIFTEAELGVRKPQCIMSERMLRLGTTKLWWRAGRAGLLTHLTTYSVVAAAVLGALADKRKPAEALRLARVTAENMSLDDTWNLKRAEQRLREEEAERNDLRLVAAAMVASGKGILAADESGGSTAKQFSALDIVDDEQHRRDYRNMLFTAEGLNDYVNAVILFDETTRQLADDGRNFTEYLTSLGIIPGVKVDKGLVEFEGAEMGSTGELGGGSDGGVDRNDTRELGGAYPGETYPNAVPDLAERLHDYYRMGLRFAKWRCALYVRENGGSDEGGDGDGGMPSERAIQANVKALAEYARICQDERIVPIVEPEVVYDGNYDIETCARATGKVLDALFEALAEEDVELEACVLKCNMVLAGAKYMKQSTPEEVGEWTAKVLREHVPAGVAGVVFLSGGQGVEQATENLRAIVKAGRGGGGEVGGANGTKASDGAGRVVKGGDNDGAGDDGSAKPFPWSVTFSFARALQGPAMKAWGGDNRNVAAAQKKLLERLKANTKALK